MIRRPPRSTRTDTLFPYSTLFRATCLEEEVGVIAVAVGDALDDLDPVVDAFDQAGVHWPAHPAEDSAPVGPQALGEVHQRRDAALPCVAQPLRPGAAPRPGRGRIPQRLELVLHRSEERRVGKRGFSTCRYWCSADH